MPLIDTDRLRTFDAYAKQYPNRRGGLGVTVSYVHQLLRAGKLPVEHLVICGINFILLPPASPAPGGGVGAGLG